MIVQQGILQQVNIAEQYMQGRPHFVTDGRDELRLGATGGLGVPISEVKLGVLPFQFGDLLGDGLSQQPVLPFDFGLGIRKCAAGLSEFADQLVKRARDGSRFPDAIDGNRTKLIDRLGVGHHPCQRLDRMGKLPQQP